MKTKKQFLLVVAFLFVSVFLVGVGGVSADDADAVWDGSGSEESFCDQNPSACYDEGSGTTEYVDTSSDLASDEEWDCSAYPGTYPDASGNCVEYSTDAVDPDVSNQSVTTYSSDGAKTQTTSTCDARESCWFINCCDATSNSQPTAAEQAAALKESTAAKAAVTTQSNVLQNATANKASADAVLSSCGTACTAAQIQAASDANAKLIKEQEEFDKKMAEYQAKAQEAGLSSGSDGSGSFALCADGYCDVSGSGGGGITVGIGGGYSSGGLPYTSSGSTLNGPKCTGPFTDIGGVCFPTNTGLSSASITSILANIFSWLMGLFTTFAVGAFVVSGIQYLMAAGDESLAESAKSNATNAVIGIIVGLSGFIIVKAIAGALSEQGYFF